MDRTVCFKRVPSPEAVCEAAHRFLGAAGDVRWDPRMRRYRATLVGASAAPFERLDPDDTLYDPVRSFEIELGSSRIVVSTGRADEFTVALADRFAEICALYWKGQRQ